MATHAARGEKITTERPERPNHVDVIPSGYIPKKGECARVIWLQKSQEVSDQSFGGYAILGGPKYHIITSSRREDMISPDSVSFFAVILLLEYGAARLLGV